MVDRPTATQALPFRARTMSLAPVTRVGSSYHVAHGLELVDELAHGLRAHVCAAGEFGEPRAGRVDLGEHGRVRGPLGESRAGDAVDDAEAEQAGGMTSMATVLVRQRGSYASGTVVLRLPEYQAAAATSADAAASIPHSRRCRCRCICIDHSACKPEVAAVDDAVEDRQINHLRLVARG
jgi:hypothetical protein